MDLLSIIGLFAFLYLALGAVVITTRYSKIKDDADLLGLPRWYHFFRETVSWVPDAVLRQRKRL